MKFRALRYTLLLIALFSITLLLRASLPTVATGTWVAAGNLSAARSGACTVALSDGRLLISGGADANGPTGTADLFSTTGSWSAAASMTAPRSHQSCAVLPNGQVLAAGGTTSGGGITNSVEIYDPSADSWTQAGVMNDARSGATASVLQDGRVLIAGGQSSGGAVNTIEIFDPNSGNFSNAGTMSSPRQDHAAAVLSDGRVLIVGGSSDGANALATTDIYDPQAASVSAGPAMSTPRARHTATTLLDGTVVVIGGSDYTNDLASAEFFDPVANNFNAASSLATARSKHSAFLLPNNNGVLVVGGQSAGTDPASGETDLASAELYIPWQKAFQATGAMATPRSDATGAALTKVNGRLLIAGGSTASAELYGFATVKTDAADYPPGTTVNITGTGWQPGETVTLTLVESPLIDTHGPYPVVADAFGNISDSSFTTDLHDVNVKFSLTAVGSASNWQAQTSFSDSQKDALTVSGGPYNHALHPGDAIPAGDAFTYSITNNGDGTSFPVGMTIAVSGFGTASPASGNISGYSPAGLATTISGTVPCNQPTGLVTLNVVGTVAASVATITPDHRNSAINITVSNPPNPSCIVPTTLSVTAASGTYGGTTTLSATLTKTSDSSAVSGKSISFTLNGNPVGNATTNGSGVATLSGVSLAGINAGSYSTGVAASFAGDSSFEASSATGSLTVNKADAVIVVTPYTSPGATYTGLAHTATVTSITGVNSETGATVGTVDVSNTTHTAAGTYSTDTWSFTGTANYNNITATTITDSIAKATAVIVVTPYTSPGTTYTGLAHTATVTSITGVNSETGATVGTVDVSNTTHTAAGTYSTDTWSFTGTANYNNITATTITDSIAKATAVIVVTPYTSPGATYTGLAHTATVTSITGVNSETGAAVGTVDVSNTMHTAAGTYASDYWFFTGSANYNDIGHTTITDSIAKATAVIVVTPYTSPGTTYTGLAHTAAVTSITGVNSETGATVGTVDVSNTTHTAAGTYSTDTWSFTGTANYNNITATTITDSIAKATAVIVVTPYTSPGTTYTGLAHTATVTSITGVNSETGAAVGTVDVSNTMHTAAGTYASDYWFFTGSANYNDIGHTTITDSIAKATAVIVVTPYTSPGTTYTGLAHTAAVTSITGVNSETGATVGTVDVSNTTHTAAGTYASDYWFFTGSANYNDIGHTTITDSIAKATAVIVVTPYTSPGTTYTGLAHTAAVTSITGVNSETGAAVGTVDVSNTTHTAAGTYSTDSWSFTGTANYDSITATTITDSIAKATAVIVVTPYTSPGTTYTGLAHTAAVTSITGVNSETGAAVGTVDVSNTMHTAAGTYASDYWFFTGSANYNDIGHTTITDSIAKATAVIVVTPYTSPGTTYTGLAHTAAVTSITGVNSETGAAVGTVDVSNTTHTAAGTYSTDSWSFTGTANYDSITATTITDSIAKATAVIVVTPYTSPGTTYTGLAHTATVTSITGVNSETGAAVGTVDVSNTMHTAAGTYASDYWFFTGSANYNDIGHTTITDSIAKATAVIVVTPYTSPGTTYTGLAHTAAVTSITGVNSETGATVGTVDVSNTTHTAAGTYSTDTWSFTGTANYNNIASMTITDSIAKATATVVVTPYSVTYDGHAHTATVTSITGVNGETGATVGTVDVSNTTHTNPGDYLSDYWFFTGTANYNNIGNTTVHDSIGYGACSVGPGGVILPPINADGSSVYSRKGGSTIPIKFNVCGANGAPLTDPTLVFAPTGGALTMTGAMRGTITVVNETGTNDIPDAAFSWDGQQWHFNMATMNLSSGYTYTFKINLAYSPASITFMVGVK